MSLRMGQSVPMTWLAPARRKTGEERKCLFASCQVGDAGFAGGQVDEGRAPLEVVEVAEGDRVGELDGRAEWVEVGETGVAREMPDRSVPFQGVEGAGEVRAVIGLSAGQADERGRSGPSSNQLRDPGSPGWKNPTGGPSPTDTALVVAHARVGATVIVVDSMIGRPVGGAGAPGDKRCDTHRNDQ